MYLWTFAFCDSHYEFAKDSSWRCSRSFRKLFYCWSNMYTYYTYNTITQLWTRYILANEYVHIKRIFLMKRGLSIRLKSQLSQTYVAVLLRGRMYNNIIFVWPQHNRAPYWGVGPCGPYAPDRGTNNERCGLT